VIGGVVLAAGEGSRFGGPKQLAELDGRPLLEHALAAMRAVPAVDPLVVVLGAHAEEIRAKVDMLDYEVVVCDRWQEGQSASLRAGLEAIGDVDGALIVLGDQPRITPQVIAMMVDHFDGTRTVRAVYDGQPGHPVILTRELIRAAKALEGDVGARELLRDAPVRRIEAGRLCRADDVDTPADLAALRDGPKHPI
jgi:molybdenum cofactor cytidylyltransferase